MYVFTQNITIYVQSILQVIIIFNQMRPNHNEEKDNTKIMYVRLLAIFMSYITPSVTAFCMTHKQQAGTQLAW